jgi:hypothetical protein
MKPTDVIPGNGICRLIGLGVDLALHLDVGQRFQLKVSFFRLRGIVVGKRALNVARKGVVPFNEIGIVAVHRPDQIAYSGLNEGMDLAREGAGGRDQFKSLVFQFVVPVLGKDGIDFSAKSHLECRLECRFSFHHI